MAKVLRWPRRSRMGWAVVLAVLAVLGGAPAFCQVLVVEPGCAKAGDTIQVTGSGWAEPNPTCEYQFFFDGITFIAPQPDGLFGPPNRTGTVPAGTAAGDHTVKVELRLNSGGTLLQCRQRKIKVVEEIGDPWDEGNNISTPGSTGINIMFDPAGVCDVPACSQLVFIQSRMLNGRQADGTVRRVTYVEQGCWANAAMIDADFTAAGVSVDRIWGSLRALLWDTARSRDPGFSGQAGSPSDKKSTMVDEPTHSDACYPVDLADPMKNIVSLLLEFEANAFCAADRQRPVSRQDHLALGAARGRMTGGVADFNGTVAFDPRPAISRRKPSWTPSPSGIPIIPGTCPARSSRRRGRAMQLKKTLLASASLAGILTAVLAAGATAVPMSQAQTFSPYLEFAAMTPAELRTLQVQLSFQGPQDEPLPSVIFTSTGNTIDFQGSRPSGGRSSSTRTWKSAVQGDDPGAAGDDRECRDAAERHRRRDRRFALPVLHDGQPRQGLRSGAGQERCAGPLCEAPAQLREQPRRPADPRGDGLCPGAADAARPADVTASATVRFSGSRPDRHTGRYAGTASVQNQSGTPPAAPLSLVLDLPGNVRLHNGLVPPAGTSPVGLQYVDLPVPAGGLAPGATASPSPCSSTIRTRNCSLRPPSSWRVRERADAEEGTMTGKNRISSLAVALLCLAAGGPLAAQTVDVHVDTTPAAGTRGRIAFTLISGNPPSNTLQILNFSTDATLDLPITEGGLVSGDLILLSNPAPLYHHRGLLFFNEARPCPRPPCRSAPPSTSRSSSARCRRTASPTSSRSRS